MAGQKSSAEDGFTKFVMLKVAEVSVAVTEPMLIVSKLPENEQEEIAINTL